MGNSYFFLSSRREFIEKQLIRGGGYVSMKAVADSLKITPFERDYLIGTVLKEEV